MTVTEPALTYFKSRIEHCETEFIEESKQRLIGNTIHYVCILGANDSKLRSRSCDQNFARSRVVKITLIVHSLQYLVKLPLKLDPCRFHQLFMVEPLFNIVLRHQDRLTDVHISYRKQITVILEKYVVTVLDNSRLHVFYKLLNLDTLIQTAHHSDTEIFKYLAAVITKILKLGQYLIKRIDLFFFRSRQKFILIDRPHDTHGAVFFIYTV